MAISQRIRLGTVEYDGAERIALVRDDGLLLLEDGPSDLRGLIGDWPRQAARIQALAATRPDVALVSLAAVRWCAPLQPGKLLCVGANYHDHVAEMDGPAGLTTPPAPFPFSFLKPSSALVGHEHEVAIPAYGRKLDWEAELAVVIGDGTAAGGPDPLNAVFGYTILNDLSLRDFLPFPHALGLDAVTSKGFDGAAPMGPWIAHAEPGDNPSPLRVQLFVNGELMQDSSTANLIFCVAELVAHFARVLTLEAGDVIATGTPAGVGAGRTPPRFLSAGDRVEARIEDLGSLGTMITAPERVTSLTIDRGGAG